MIYILYAIAFFAGISIFFNVFIQLMCINKYGWNRFYKYTKNDSLYDEIYYYHKISMRLFYLIILLNILMMFLAFIYLSS